MIARNILFILWMCCSVAHAKWARMPYEAIRATGMGGAYIAVSDDKDSIWYNPGGLSRLSGVSFDLYDFIAGADSASSLSALRQGLLTRQTSSAVSTGTQFSRFAFSPTFYLNNMAFSLFYNFQSFSEIESLTLSEVDLYGMSDLGFIGGYSYPITPEFSVGASIKAISRSGIDVTKSPADLLAQLAINSDTFLANVYDATKPLAGKGFGLGYSLGVLYSMPLSGRSNQWRFGFTCDDIGNTNFSASAGSNKPKSIPMTVNFGTAAIYNWGRSTMTFSLDFRDFTGGLAGVKSAHMGAEMRFGMFSIRTGLYQGYPSGGFGIDVDFLKVNFSTYGVELGQGLLERNQRWYLLQIILGLTGSGRRAAPSGGGGGGGGGWG